MAEYVGLRINVSQDKLVVLGPLENRVLPRTIGNPPKIHQNKLVTIEYAFVHPLEELAHSRIQAFLDSEKVDSYAFLTERPS
ncbi:MAG: hypothetical protein ABIE22_01780 [archaeon]